MKVNKIRVSAGVKFFTKRMMDKFNLTVLNDNTSSVVVYGMHRAEDYTFFEAHKPFKIVLWRGTDALKMNKEKANIILKDKNSKHYAISENVELSLARYNIKSQILPITSTLPDIKCAPRGDMVYCYIGSGVPSTLIRYKMQVLKRLEHGLPYKFIYTKFDKYSYEDLLEVYKKCFVGVRLLDYDGMSNSILEMGLMGRRTISNSALPYTIKWHDERDIRKSIEKEYLARGEDNKYIHDAYLKLIDIGNKWLEI